MRVPTIAERYDVVVAGARCAGASTAMLLARAGMKVLVVDPAPPGTDTLSTHALMRGAVVQLHRWGLLESVKESGAPVIRHTTFHYGDESRPIEIKERDGIDGLYAPRRTVLDRLLIDSAREAGADVAHGAAVRDLVKDGSGRVRGVVLALPDGETRQIRADLVIGADGVWSKVGRLAGAQTEYRAKHATASIYGHWDELDWDTTGYHWLYRPGMFMGTIPTNDGRVCVFASATRDHFMDGRGVGLVGLFSEMAAEVSPELAARMDEVWWPKLRAFAGIPGFIRRSYGPGWALVGDASYFKDPATAHGITDALRDAELLARAVVIGTDEALADYQAVRDGLSMGLMEVTDRIAALDWTMDELAQHHLALSREMKKETEFLLALDRDDHLSGSAATGQAA